MVYIRYDRIEWQPRCRIPPFLPAALASCYDARMRLITPHWSRKFVAASLLAFAMLFAMPNHASAAPDDEVEHYDARVQGYDPDVELKGSGTGGSWTMLILLGVVSISVLFKDAKRSHLD